MITPSQRARSDENIFEYIFWHNEKINLLKKVKENRTKDILKQLRQCNNKLRFAWSKLTNQEKSYMFTRFS